MTDYNAIAEAETDPGAPGTSSLWKRWSKNWIAGFEGAPGTPYLQQVWHPYNGAAQGDGNTGLLWSFAANGAVGSVETPTLLAGYDYRMRISGLSIGGTVGGSLLLGCYFDASAAWSAAATMGTIASISAVGDGEVELLSPVTLSLRHRLRAWYSDVATAGISSGYLTDFLFTGSIAHNVTKARVYPSVAAFDAGAIYLDKRKIY